MKILLPSSSFFGPHSYSLVFLLAFLLSSDHIARGVAGVTPPPPRRGKKEVGKKEVDYEVWGSDQSNSVPGQSAVGVRGGYLWVWDSASIESQINGDGDATPLPCSPEATQGPCDLFEIFPTNLAQMNSDGTPTGNTLGDLPSVGRWHGVRKDPSSNKYVLASIFARGGGYVGIIDTRTKEAIALFRVTNFSFSDGAGDRSVHMGFWSVDGSQCIIANLHGKAVERINIERDWNGDITSAYFDTDASLGLGKNMAVVEPATYFEGTNAYGRQLIGGVRGNYQAADLQDFTPNGKCKENGCGGGVEDDGSAGGRLNNLPICPVPGQEGLLYITLAGGGMLIGDTTSTPMRIVAEYGNNIIYGAGCSGVEVGSKMYMDSGVSASPAGATQSNFAIWSFENTDYLLGAGSFQPENSPMPVLIFEDPGNTATLGNLNGPPSVNDGQLPGETVRRDSHGATPTVDGKYVHTVDRIQGEGYVFNTRNNEGGFTYSLRTDGKGNPSACEAYSVRDDENLPSNDPAPDLTESTPDGKYVAIAFRGPVPVSVSHSAQGSCPGVGIVALKQGGKSGELVTVLRTTNTISDNVESITIPGGVDYVGAERSDVHDTTVIDRTLFR